MPVNSSVEDLLRAVRRHGQLPEGRRPIMVVSHERSGTHFTMNSLGACLGYVADPWIDLDSHVLNINYHHPLILKDALTKIADLRSPLLIKAHHAFGFFADIVGGVEGLQVVYVYRRPANVMRSFWRFLHSWPWNEGPKAARLMEFVEARPSGALLRYQETERTTMLDRWASHVAGWLEAAERHPNVHAVRYEDLDRRYADTVARLAESIDARPVRLERPPFGSRVQSGPLKPELAETAEDVVSVWQRALSRHPRLMTALGYTQPPAPRGAG